MKKCGKCKKKKPLEGFYKNKSKKDGLQSRCKDCIKDYNAKNREVRLKKQREYYELNKEAQRQRGRIYYLNNKENRKKYFHENKERVIGIAIKRILTGFWKTTQTPICCSKFWKAEKYTSKTKRRDLE